MYSYHGITTIIDIHIKVSPSSQHDQIDFLPGAIRQRQRHSMEQFADLTPRLLAGLTNPLYTYQASNEFED